MLRLIARAFWTALAVVALLGLLAGVGISIAAFQPGHEQGLGAGVVCILLFGSGLATSVRRLCAPARVAARRPRLAPSAPPPWPADAPPPPPEREVVIGGEVHIMIDDEAVDHPDRFFTKVSGVTFDNPGGRNRQEIVRECRIGDELRIQRMRGHPYNPDAVAVLTWTGEQLGWLSEYRSEMVAPALARGGRFRARVSDVTQRTEEGPRGLNIEVLRVR